METNTSPQSLPSPRAQRIADLVSERAQLNQVISERDALIENLKDTLSAVKAECAERLAATEETCSQAINDRDREIAWLQNVADAGIVGDLAIARESVAELAARNTDLTAQVAELGGRVNTADVDYVFLKESYARLQADRDNISTIAKTYAAEIAQYDRRYKANNDELESSRIDRERYQIKIDGFIDLLAVEQSGHYESEKLRQEIAVAYDQVSAQYNQSRDYAATLERLLEESRNELRALKDDKRAAELAVVESRSFCAQAIHDVEAAVDDRDSTIARLTADLADRDRAIRTLCTIISK